VLFSSLEVRRGKKKKTPVILITPLRITNKCRDQKRKKKKKNVARSEEEGRRERERERERERASPVLAQNFNVIPIQAIFLLILSGRNG